MIVFATLGGIAAVAVVLAVTEFLGIGIGKPGHRVDGRAIDAARSGALTTPHDAALGAGALSAGPPPPR